MFIYSPAVVQIVVSYMLLLFVGRTVPKFSLYAATKNFLYVIGNANNGTLHLTTRDLLCREGSIVAVLGSGFGVCVVWRFFSLRIQNYNTVVTTC